ncbi:unnamed protein product [Ilex paraguariensis]|uniref:Wall-associated receptor kinase galacturonan-binding domain-containing protein n=1 Tax=Ilex paraguariensis TaxID=185542 RepID=A0ABC8R8W1_9AQUA
MPIHQNAQKNASASWLAMSLWIDHVHFGHIPDKPLHHLQQHTYMISKGANITKPRCQRQCGNITVPYPFGIGTGCAIDSWLEINCNTSFNPPKPFIGGVEVRDISDSQVRITNVVANKCYDRLGALTHEYIAWTNLLSSSPYSFSDANKFTVIGCDDLALITGSESKGRNFTSGYAFLGEENAFTFRGASDFLDPDFMNKTLSTVPTVLDWGHYGDGKKTGSGCIAESSQFPVIKFTLGNHLLSLFSIFNEKSYCNSLYLKFNFRSDLANWEDSFS